jgi:SAM-dependent methyltransferase
VTRLQRHKRDWERLAAEDPLWAVLTDPARRGRRWRVEDFLATGEAEIAGALEEAAELDLPERRGSALDFGCGAGRLTRALSLRFERAVGVDISVRR